MGKLVRILLLGLVVLIANMNATSVTIAFPNVPNVTSCSSFYTEIPKTVLKVIENDLVLCSQSG